MPAPSPTTSTSKASTTQAKSRWDYPWYTNFFEFLSVINAGGNAAISGDAAGKNIAAGIIGAGSGFYNSYSASGAVITTETPEYSGWNKWLYRWIFRWLDPASSFIYALICGAITTASTFTLLYTIGGGLLGIYAIIGLLGLMCALGFYRSRRGLQERNKVPGQAETETKFQSMIKILGFTLAVVGILVAIVTPLIFTPGGAALIPTIYLVLSYSICIIIGLSGIIVNYEMSVGYISAGILKKDDKTKITNTTPNQNSKTNLATRILNFVRSLSVLKIVAILTCLASAGATGGLACVSIMALPAAFGATAPFLPLLIVGLIGAVITTAALMALLYKPMLAIISTLPEQIKNYLILVHKDKPDYQPKTSWDYFKYNTLGLLNLLISVPKRYQDQKIKYFIRQFIFILLVALILVGTIMTMLQASNALANTISSISNLGRNASAVADTVLVAATVADSSFNLSYGILVAFWILNFICRLDDANTLLKECFDKEKAGDTTVVATPKGSPTLSITAVNAAGVNLAGDSNALPPPKTLSARADSPESPSGRRGSASSSAMFRLPPLKAPNEARSLPLIAATATDSGSDSNSDNEEDSLLSKEHVHH